ncbi:Serine/threonine protein kinase [Trichophyton interdigitale]|uniref:Serine/threonine protein kinase n=1 Tax=Trichophyton interdigitale TaxID=101480 RepID=A0A9P4YKL7_9EURO|nr:Serine/threonine protein kinase [Trichophyton interdigitale]
MIQTTFPKCLWDLPFVNRGVSGIIFAVDELSVIKTPTGGEKNAEEFRVERKILERLGDHPRIVKLLYTYRKLIVFEWLRYPLRFRTWELREDGRTASDDDILKWSAQAAQGMQYFHAKGVLQVDIGLHNLLVDWDDNVKYCDFSGSSIDGSRPTVVASPTAQHPKACSCSSLHFSSVLELYSGPQAVVINPGHAGFYV